MLQFSHVEVEVYYFDKLTSNCRAFILCFFLLAILAFSKFRRQPVETADPLMDSNSEQGVDRISGLPDHIICHILSFLPTKDAVATSILSSRWRYLWTSIPILDFDVRLHGGLSSAMNLNVNQGSEAAFQEFVSKVLVLNGMPYIQKLRLVYESHYGIAPIHTWLHVALARNIQELELDLFFSLRNGFIEFPRRLFTSNSLIVLKLSRMLLDVPSFVSFPRLKILELKRVIFFNDKCTENVLSGCQVLEELVIEETVRDKPKVVHISIHTLKRFSFSYRFAMETMVDCPYKFFINAPKIEYFHVKGRISDEFVLKSSANLINVHLDLCQTGVFSDNYNYSMCCQHICSFFKEISNVKFLTLSGDVVQLLFESLDQTLPSFLNMTNLAIGIDDDTCWKMLVIDFIKCSPNLEVLTLNNKLGYLGDVDDLQKTPPQPVPEYMLSYLKDLLIKTLYDNIIPEAVEFLPQDVNVLKKLKINCLCPSMLKIQMGLTPAPF